MEQTAWHHMEFLHYHSKDPATQSEYAQIKCPLSLYTIPDMIIMSYYIMLQCRTMFCCILRKQLNAFKFTLKPQPVEMQTNCNFKSASVHFHCHI